MRCGSDAVVGAASPSSVDGLRGPGSGASSAGAGEGVSLSRRGSKNSRDGAGLAFTIEAKIVSAALAAVWDGVATGDGRMAALSSVPWVRPWRRGITTTKSTRIVLNYEEESGHFNVGNHQCVPDSLASLR
jgi:hypothetical protein